LLHKTAVSVLSVLSVFVFEIVSVVSCKYNPAAEQKKGLTLAPSPVANRVDINVKPLTFQITKIARENQCRLNKIQAIKLNENNCKFILQPKYRF